jgi:hypothetical protein
LQCNVNEKPVSSRNESTPTHLPNRELERPKASYSNRCQQYMRVSCILLLASDMKTIDCQTLTPCSSTLRPRQYFLSHYYELNRCCNSADQQPKVSPSSKPQAHPKTMPNCVKCELLTAIMGPALFWNVTSCSPPDI